MVEQVPIGEAARRLHISVETVRRRIKRGELAAVQVKRPQGYVWLVELPEAPVSEAPPEVEPEASTQYTALADALQRENAHLTEMVDILKAQVESQDRSLRAAEEQAVRHAEAEAELRRLLGNAQQQLSLLLPAPREDGQTFEGQSYESKPEEKGDPERRRPWWRFWGNAKPAG